MSLLENIKSKGKTLYLVKNKRLTNATPLGWEISQVEHGYERYKHANGDGRVLYRHYKCHGNRADHAEQSRVPREIFKRWPFY